MANFPDSQKKAQEEIDRVLQGRLPTHTDKADLPLVVESNICPFTYTVPLTSLQTSLCYEVTFPLSPFSLRLCDCVL